MNEDQNFNTQTTLETAMTEAAPESIRAFESVDEPVQAQASEVEAPGTSQAQEAEVQAQESQAKEATQESPSQETITAEQLKQKALALMEEAKRLEEAERSQALHQIKSLVQRYDIHADEVFQGGFKRKRRPMKKVAKAENRPEIKYRGPNGEIWTGGPGRRPAWVVEILKRGESLGDYRI
ncbi:MAG: H-NS histone family protein [Gammaproteobacteria bacterium]|nr:H-NS histone family protein [Gammaproteobacteria bacterium]